MNSGLVLPQLANKRAPFSNPTVEGHRHPLLQVCSTPLTQQTRKLVQQHLGLVDLGMDLTGLLERSCFLLRISKMPSPLDIRFLVEQDLFPFQHPLPCDLHYSEIWRENYQQELCTGTWKHWNDIIRRDPDLTVHLTILHQYGICLYGKPIAEALPPVPEQDFRDAIIKDVQVTLGDPLHDPISFVLNACRACAYLQHGTILSKDAGGVWGLAHLPEQYHPLIQQALALYRGERLGQPVGHAAWDDFAASMHAAIQH